MSLSNPKLVNPATKFLTWCSQDNEDKGLIAGTFYYYDKEQEKNIIVDLPIYCVGLDQFSTITGYHEGSNSGIISNEVRYLDSEILNVRTFQAKGGFKLVGKYKDISAEVKANGGKFCKSVYAVVIWPDNKFEIVNFQLKGAAFAAWVEAKINIEATGFKCSKFEEMKKGANKYHSPIFESLVIGKQRKELWDFAINADKQLQAFVRSRKAAQAEAEAATDLGVTSEPLTEGDWLTAQCDDELPY